MVHEARQSVRRRLAAEPGTALIETALVIPVVLVLVMGIVLTGRIVHAQIAVQSVAREAGRTLAVAPSASDGVAAAEQRAFAVADGHGLASDRLQFTVDAGNFARGGTVQAQASYPVSIGDLPLLGALEVSVSSSHTERVELYRSRSDEPP